MANTNGAVKRQINDPQVDSEVKKFKGDVENVGSLPYRDIPYDEQLTKKQAEVEKIFSVYGNLFSKKYPQFARWYKDVFLQHRFKLDNILKCPLTEHYRNKCELTIGYNPELGKLCAGPRIANTEDGKVQVGPCKQDVLIHLPTSMIEIAQDFSNFLDKWNYLEEKCPWFNLYIRCTRAGDHMIIAIVRDDNQDQLKELKNELVKYYTDDYALKYPVKSIFIQPRKEDSTKKSFELDFLHVHGEEFLVEKLIDLSLVVTPGIFFRINTYAAEVLYQKTLDLADLKRKSTLLIDLWCGCGEVALLAAKRAMHVIAIDPSKWNIKKAQFMARHNKIRNIDFIIAPPEEGLKQVWHQLPMAEEIVIIADPPTLCKMMVLGDMAADMSNLKKFIYLHSSHKLHLVKNMLSFTEGSLLPTRVIPVDVSPHNVRLELIACLKRVDPHEKLADKALDPTTTMPSAEMIEQIERRAFAMGMAKAMAEVAAVPPVRGALPSVLDEDYGYGGVAARRAPVEEFGGPGRGGFKPAAGGRFGAARGGGGGFGAAERGGYGAADRGYGAADRGYGAAEGYGAADRGYGAADRGYGAADRGGYGGYEDAADDYGPMAGGFGAGAGRGKFSAARGGFGGAAPAKKAGYGGPGLGAGYGGGYAEDFSGYGGGYGRGEQEVGGGFGFAAKRGRGGSGGGFSKDAAGFGRSGFSTGTESYGGGYGARGAARGRGGARGGRGAR